MLESVEPRFTDRVVPNPIEWLSHNGSRYRTHETILFAQSIGLVSSLTPVRSPQSNGLAESFVKTFKRDYVYVHDRPDAQPVLGQLPRWFEGDNEHHPHKALRMNSPREFIRSFQQPAAACPVCRGNPNPQFRPLSVNRGSHWAILALTALNLG